MEKIKYILDLNYFLPSISNGITLGLGLGFFIWLCGFGIAKVISIFKGIIKIN